MSIRVHVHGAGGHMGRAACVAIDAAEDMQLCARTGRGDLLADQLQLSKPDVMVEFTVPGAVDANIRTALAQGVHVVSGTTGLSNAASRELGELAERHGLGCMLAPNFSVGVILMQRFATAAARWFDDVEIIEMHHANKLDAPSGTSLHTAKLIREAAGRPLNQRRPASPRQATEARGAVTGDIPIHSLRLPGLLAHQEVLFGALGQTLSIRHDCRDRQAFMPGVLCAVRRISEFRGLVNSLEPLLDEEC